MTSSGALELTVGRAPSAAWRALLALGIWALAAESSCPAIAQGVGAPASSEAEVEADQAVDETIVVTAGRTEQRIDEIPVQVSVFGAEDLERTATQTTDDFLRQLPSFNLQRTDSSRVLNHSTQGIAYRGLGGNSASRALVVVDGVPLNEPFAGWIAWSRVPLASVERIEVVPGGGAVAWGNQSLGGVIQVFTRRPRPRALDVHARYGSRQTLDAGVFGSHVAGPVAFSGHASALDTDGFSLVPEGIRGPADTPASSSTGVLDGRLQLAPNTRQLVTLQATHLDDDRRSGAGPEEEHLTLLSFRAAADITGSGGGSWQLHAFSLERDASDFRYAIEDDRTAVSPRRTQWDNPSESLGLSASWSRSLRGDAHRLSAGVDGLSTSSEVNEDTRFDGNAFTQRFRSGGDQLLSGVHFQDSALVGSRLRLVGGGRVDYWRTSDGEFFGVALDTGEVLYDDDLPARSEVVWSPSFGLRYEVTERLALRGSAFQSFRAPSPNELFKSSPSERTYLAGNNELVPERIVLGLETGLDFVPGRAFSVRATAFWNEVADLVTDVTVGRAGNAPEVVAPCGLLRPRGTCRQRRNVEGARNRGIELDVEARPFERWRFAGAWTYADSRIVDSPEEPALEGKRLRRVPEHQGTLQASWEGEAFGVSLQARYQGERYEEDLNTLLIDEAVVFDLHLSRPIGPNVGVFVSVENVFDSEIAVGETETYTEIGQPRWVHAGLRYRFGGR